MTNNPHTNALILVVEDVDETRYGMEKLAAVHVAGIPRKSAEMRAVYANRIDYGAVLFGSTNLDDSFGESLPTAEQRTYDRLWIERTLRSEWAS